MKKLHFLTGLFTTIFILFNITFALGHQVTLNVTQCDPDAGTGDYFAEIYGTDTAGIVHDYTLQQDSGYFVFPDVATGYYEIAAYREGFKLYKHSQVFINNDLQEDIVLEQNLLPPSGFAFDAQSLVAVWDDPKLTLMDEKFENPVFPPLGWQGNLFVKSNDNSFPYIDPWPSNYAAEPSSQGVTGTAYLKTTPVDLREASHFKLNFDYLFIPEAGEPAYVEYSTDGGTTWYLLDSIEPSAHWGSAVFDLTFLSGVGGKRMVNFKFVFEHPENNSSVGAIDNVQVFSSVSLPETYSIYLDGELTDQLPATVHSDTLYCIDYGELHNIAVSAGYSCGTGNSDPLDFFSEFLPMVKKPFFTYNEGDNYVTFHLEADDSCDSTWQYFGLLGFNIFRDGDSIMNVPFVPGQGNITYAVDEPGINSHHYCASAVYDLTYWGYPGQTAQSATVCDSVFVAYGNSIPFTEEWNSGDFEFNHWYADAYCVVDNSTGNPAPSAVFNTIPGQSNYEQRLESYPLLTNNKAGALWLDFDIKLEDTAVYAGQFLVPEVRDINGVWHATDIITGTQNFDWENKKTDVTGMVMAGVSVLRFTVSGDPQNTNRKWYLDNIKVYRTCRAAGELTADYIWDGTFGIKVQWHHTFSDNPNENKGLQGFNLYRKSDNMNDYKLYRFIPFADTGYISYNDMWPDVDPQTGYFYKLTALYVVQDDTLESEFTKSLLEPDNDFVYAFVTGKNELSTGEGVVVYPVPAAGSLFVQADGTIDKLELYSVSGQKIKDFRSNGSSTQNIDVYDIPPGVYFLKIKCNNKSPVKKIVVK